MFNANDFIKHKQDILINNRQNQATLHIAFGFDNNYAMPTGVTIASIIENNPNIDFIVHLFMNNVSNVNINKFSQFSKKNLTIVGYHLNDKLEINPDTLAHYNMNVSLCIRFLIPEVLKDITDTILYLDSDVLCLNSLKKLTEYQFEDNIAFVVPDSPNMQNAIKTMYKVDHTKYFNAGLIFINNKKWCEEQISKRALELINNGTIYKFVDQDVLNILLEGKTLLLPIKFNTKIHTSHSGLEEDLIASYTVILHYVSGHKPWYKVYHSKLFNNYLAKSPWLDDEMPLADKNSSLRGYANYLFNKKDYVNGFKYTILYLKGKVFK